MGSSKKRITAARPDNEVKEPQRASEARGPMHPFARSPPVKYYMPLAPVPGRYWNGRNATQKTLASSFASAPSDPASEYVRDDQSTFFLGTFPRAYSKGPPPFMERQASVAPALVSTASCALCQNSSPFFHDVDLRSSWTGMSGHVRQAHIADHAGAALNLTRRPMRMVSGTGWGGGIGHPHGLVQQRPLVLVSAPDGLQRHHGGHPAHTPETRTLAGKATELRTRGANCKGIRSRRNSSTYGIVPMR